MCTPGVRPCTRDIFTCIVRFHTCKKVVTRVSCKRFFTGRPADGPRRPPFYTLQNHVFRGVSVARGRRHVSVRPGGHPAGARVCTPGSDPVFSVIFDSIVRFHAVNFVKNLPKIVKFCKILQNFAKSVFPGVQKVVKNQYVYP